MSRDRRRAENEAVFRAVNERIAALGRRYGAESLDLVCECSSAECTQRLRLPASMYERVRADSAYFLVIPGHETAGIERVVERSEGYCVVEKGGEAAEIAAATDPRS